MITNEAKQTNEIILKWMVSVVREANWESSYCFKETVHTNMYFIMIYLQHVIQNVLIKSLNSTQILFVLALHSKSQCNKKENAKKNSTFCKRVNFF